MIERIIILISCCFMLSLSAYAERPIFISSQEYIASDKQMISDSMMIVKFIAQVADDKNLIKKIDAMNLVPSYDVVQKYSDLCVVIDWSLKDFKKIEKDDDFLKIQNFFYQAMKLQDLHRSQLFTMQRDNRRSVKDIIAKIEDLSNSDNLQISLQQLFHALHEVKKEIATLDKVSSIRAWYIYITLLFLQVMLMQGINYIQMTIHQKNDQQVIMYELTYLAERFKHSMLSDFTIEKGVL